MLVAACNQLRRNIIQNEIWDNTHVPHLLFLWEYCVNYYHAATVHHKLLPSVGCPIICRVYAFMRWDTNFWADCRILLYLPSISHDFEFTPRNYYRTHIQSCNISCNNLISAPRRMIWEGFSVWLEIKPIIAFKKPCWQVESLLKRRCKNRIRQSEMQTFIWLTTPYLQRWIGRCCHYQQPTACTISWIQTQSISHSNRATVPL